MEMFNEFDHLIKLIIVGESGVGKSSLLNRYCDNNYTDTYMSTIGVDFKIKNLKIDNRKVKIQVWDTAGQERFKGIINSYYRGAHAVMLVFDLTNIYTFNKLSEWLETIKENIKNDYKIILVGAKCDATGHIQVLPELIKEFVTLNKLNYIEVSAKKNINIEIPFMKIANEVIYNSNIVTTNANNKLVKVMPLLEKKNKNKVCCF